MPTQRARPRLRHDVAGGHRRVWHRRRSRPLLSPAGAVPAFAVLSAAVRPRLFRSSRGAATRLSRPGRYRAPAASAARWRRCWMIYDLVYASVPLRPLADRGRHVRANLASSFSCCPASVLMSVFVIDRIGRKPLQVWGFLSGSVLLGIFALMAMPTIAPSSSTASSDLAETGPVSGAGVLCVARHPQLSPTVRPSPAAGVSLSVALRRRGPSTYLGDRGAQPCRAVLTEFLIVPGACRSRPSPKPRRSRRPLRWTSMQHLAGAQAGWQSGYAEARTAVRFQHFLRCIKGS